MAAPNSHAYGQIHHQRVNQPWANGSTQPQAGDASKGSLAPGMSRGTGQMGV